MYNLKRKEDRTAQARPLANLWSPAKRAARPSRTPPMNARTRRPQDNAGNASMSAPIRSWVYRMHSVCGVGLAVKRGLGKP